MFRYLIICIFLLLAKEVRPQGQGTVDSTTDVSTDVLTSTLDGTSATGGGVTQPGVNTATSSAGGNSNTPSGGGSSGGASSGGSSSGGSSSGGVTSGVVPSGETSAKSSDSTVGPTGTGATRTDNSSATDTPATNKFYCYKGNCTGADCHKNGTIYSSLEKVVCAKNECSMTVTQNTNWSGTEFSCNDGECMCQKAVTGKYEMCCKTTECNDKTLKCSHSSHLGASLVVPMIVFVGLYLLN